MPLSIMARRFALFLCLCPTFLLAPPLEAAAPLSLVLLHTGDLHGHLESEEVPPDQAFVGGERWGGMALLASAMYDEKRKALFQGKHVLAMDAGDLLQGTPAAAVTEGKSVVRCLAHLGFWATTVGNHEFDYDQYALHERMRQSSFLWLVSNLRLPWTHRRLRPWASYDMKGARGKLRVAFVGITSPDTPRITLKSLIEGMTFLAPEAVLPDLIHKLRNELAMNLIVVLSHCGLEYDRMLAEKVPGIDCILGGHSHSLMAGAERVGNTIIHHAGAYGRYLGVVELSVDGDTGEIVGHEARTLDLRSSRYRPDASTETLVGELTEEVNRRMARVVGQAVVDLPRGVRGGEAPMAALVAEALRHVAKTELSIVNLGGVRTGLARGPITLGKAHTILPFRNHLVKGYLSGAELRALLEESVDGNWAAVTEERKAFYRAQFHFHVDGWLAVERPHGFLCFGGLRYRFDPRRPEGARIVAVETTTGPLRDDATYSVVTNNFLHQGGDGFTRLQAMTRVEEEKTLCVDAFLRYLEARPEIRDYPEDSVINVTLEAHPMEGYSHPIQRIK